MCKPHQPKRQICIAGWAAAKLALTNNKESIAIYGGVCCQCQLPTTTSDIRAAGNCMRNRM